MKTKKKYNYIEWLSAEEMHEETLRWISELKFARDEHLFLNDLVKSYTLDLTEERVFQESKKLIGTLLTSQKEVVQLMKKVRLHENLLEVMVNDIDELIMEKAYLETHRELTFLVQTYLTDYRTLKANLFKLISSIMKQKKQKRLLN